MRRVWLVIALAGLMTAIGCGKENYNKRMAKTLEKMEKDKRIKKNLMEAANDKKFTDLAIYVRPPKDEAYAKAGQLPVGEGQFDLDASFNDKVDASLHVLARVKKPKKTPAKGAPPAAVPATARGAFDADVLSVLSNVFGSPDALLTPKFTQDVKAGTPFKRLIFPYNDKEVKVYFYKQDAYEVALIFVYGTSLKGPLSSKIELCLEAFATGQKATKLFQGGNVDEESESGPAMPM
jgi:hypothetical protein